LPRQHGSRLTPPPPLNGTHQSIPVNPSHSALPHLCYALTITGSHVYKLPGITIGNSHFSADMYADDLAHFFSSQSMTLKDMVSD